MLSVLVTRVQQPSRSQAYILYRDFVRGRLYECGGGGEELSVVRCNGPRIELPCTRCQSSSASTRETGHWSRGGGGAVLVLPVHSSSGNLCFSRACIGRLGLVSITVRC